MASSVNLAALESHLWEAANILREVDAADFKIDQIRARDGNLSIPLDVAPAAKSSTDENSGPAGRPDLASALEGWLKSSGEVRQALRSLLDVRS